MMREMIDSREGFDAAAEEEYNAYLDSTFRAEWEYEYENSK